jgi:hypothetical protein
MGSYVVASAAEEQWDARAAELRKHQIEYQQIIVDCE